MVLHCQWLGKGGVEWRSLLRLVELLALCVSRFSFFFKWFVIQKVSVEAHREQNGEEDWPEGEEEE